jgi:hypothetical protein
MIGEKSVSSRKRIAWRGHEDDLTYVIITFERGDNVRRRNTIPSQAFSFSLTGLLKGHSLGLGDAVIQIQFFAIFDTRTPANAATLAHEINCELDSSSNQIFLGGSRWGACRPSLGLHSTAVCRQSLRDVVDCSSFLPNPTCPILQICNRRASGTTVHHHR